MELRAIIEASGFGISDRASASCYLSITCITLKFIIYMYLWGLSLSMHFPEPVDL
jgi:hypothetical protein